MACGVAVKRPLVELGGSEGGSSSKRARPSPAGGGNHCASWFGQQQEDASSPFAIQAASFSQALDSTSSSPFANVSTTNLSSEQLKSYLQAEVNYLKRRKLLPSLRRADGGREVVIRSGGSSSKNSIIGGGSAYSRCRSPPSPMGGSHSSDDEISTTSASATPIRPTNNNATAVASANSAQHRTNSFAAVAAAGDVFERPLFSMKHVQLICERLLKEQEVRLRFEYENALSAKLAEQYDTFVKFTQDQIKTQMDKKEELPSYLS